MSVCHQTTDSTDPFARCTMRRRRQAHHGMARRRRDAWPTRLTPASRRRPGAFRGRTEGVPEPYRQQPNILSRRRF